MTPAAWWYIPSLAGLFVLIGAVTALISTKLSDHRKFKREDLARWDDEFREVYVKTMRATDPFVSIILVKPSDVRGVSDYGARRHEAFVALLETSATLDIIGDRDIRRSMAQLVDSVRTVLMNPLFSDQDFDAYAARRIVEEDRDLFLNEVRRLLRVEIE